MQTDSVTISFRRTPIFSWSPASPSAIRTLRALYPHPGACGSFLYEENYGRFLGCTALIYKDFRGGMTLEMADLKLNRLPTDPKRSRLWWCG